ncbi:MAG: carotenoid biosynthesis protein [Anaerolineales bacterium]|nr:MAG: carotenoid biosynthesis protein [Anaerolineales bacterium]
MPNPYFLIFELIVFMMFLGCLKHAWQIGMPKVWQLIAGVLFGLLLEWATIQQLQAYQYGRFSLMLGEVPIMVGVGWGVILYSVRLFSDATKLTEWARPIMDGLLALNIDLATDTLAIRLGMWDWGIGFEAQYFGVPYANFWAWFWVVFAFSAGLRLLTRRPGWVGLWLAPWGAIAIGLLGVLITNALITFWLPKNWYVPTIAITLSGALILLLLLKPKLPKRPIPKPAFWVPLGFHGYFLIIGLFTRTILNPPFLLLVSAAMALVALLLHRSTVRELWARTINQNDPRS